MMAPFKVGPFAFFHHYCQLLQWQSLRPRLRDLMANLSHFYITEGCVVVLLGKTAKNNIGPGWTTKPVTSYEPNQLMRQVPVKTWTLLKKVPLRSEMMVSRSECRHAPLGALVRKGGIGDASGRKDPFRAALCPATFIKLILSVWNLKAQVKFKMQITCSPAGVSLNHLQTFMTRSQILFILLKNTLPAAKLMEYQLISCDPRSTY